MNTCPIIYSFAGRFVLDKLLNYGESAHVLLYQPTRVEKTIHPCRHFPIQRAAKSTERGQPRGNSQPFPSHPPPQYLPISRMQTGNRHSPSSLFLYSLLTSFKGAVLQGSQKDRQLRTNGANFPTLRRKPPKSEPYIAHACSMIETARMSARRLISQSIRPIITHQPHTSQANVLHQHNGRHSRAEHTIERASLSTSEKNGRLIETPGYRTRYGVEIRCLGFFNKPLS